MKSTHSNLVLKLEKEKTRLEDKCIEFEKMLDDQKKISLDYHEKYRN
jgi:hypothetical protein